MLSRRRLSCAFGRQFGLSVADATTNRASQVKKPQKNRVLRDLIVVEDLCFVMMPFGPRFNDLFAKVYEPAIREAALQPVRADSVFTSAPIMEDIWRLLRRASMVLADLSGRNPNVFYELGLAHGIGTPAVLVADNIEDVPFDLRTLRLVLRKPRAPASQLRGEIVRAVGDTRNDPRAALPLAATQPKRAFETEHAFGGDSIDHEEFERIRRILEDVPEAEIEHVLSGRLDQLSKKTQMRLAGRALREAEMERFASKEVVDITRGRLATIGRRFPWSLLAECVYSIQAGSEHIAVRTLVETGFARDYVEANIILDVVEWAVYEKPSA